LGECLDDTGNSFGDAVQDEFAECEREEISKRTQDGLLEVSGIFAEVSEEAATGSSKCKLSSLSV
jgi:hypothetical protein